MRKSTFKSFYERHFDRVYRFVFFRVANNTELAQDLTSEVFMKALRNFEKYDESKSDAAWIMTITRNHLINHYRDKKDHVDVDDVQFSLEGIDGRAQEQSNDDVRHLYRALNSMQKSEKEMIELKHLQGYKYKEIGLMLGKTEGACRTEAHRAMKKLKEVMQKLYEES